ncbi:M6 family metalloprotease domain-containing protein [Motilibacter sp. E257]|uniref:M6 family metalloprotease domain-containing protein n=2 Tax=Motilibacter deserti TaxID=2714956 RepID=A0ABX0GZX7_9ACTN|nr:M6 family metalloprotease domain-containing protein [Motilibacter deserti]
MRSRSTPGALRSMRSLRVVTVAAAAVAAGALALPGQSATAASGVVGPIDPQNWVNPDNMTWSDYKPVPDTDWANKLTGDTRTFKGAVVLVDYPDMPFAVTQPPQSTIFGNPSLLAHDIPRSQVAQFYEDFLNKPQDLNHHVTINSYWQEDSNGKFGVDLDAFGPYLMPFKSYQYGIDNGFNAGSCPVGDACNKNMRTDGQAAWLADVGQAVIDQYDFTFYLGAGQDESSSWQEFGSMLFASPADVPDAWGPPSPTNPETVPGKNAARTRYVPWTSWKAAATIWPNANLPTATRKGSSIQAESSGMGTYAHEFSHILTILDNYNNPFGGERAYTGPWSMMSRGSFLGPGGPHSRWQIPPVNGASLGSQHMLRDKIKLGIIDEENVLRIDSSALANSGVVVAKVQARAAKQDPGEISGINIRIGRDASPVCGAVTFTCDGNGRGNSFYQNYTMEVVDRMGDDSFQGDHGVLISKTKDQDNAPFVWTIDANPQDINQVDYYDANGQPQMMTRGDFRQLLDAPFHAGTDSGSEYEYVDEANGLHFYVIDIERDAKGILSYTLAVKSTKGAGAVRRGVEVIGKGEAASAADMTGTTCSFTIENSGRTPSASATAGHPENVSAFLDSDVYRLSVATRGEGWSASLPNALATAKVGETAEVLVNVKAAPGAKHQGAIVLTATSESDPTKVAHADCKVKSVR